MEISNNIVAASTAADIEPSNAVQQVASQAKESAPPKKSETSDTGKKLTPEQAKSEAKELEKLLNNPADTEIKFNVKLVTAGGGEEGGHVTDFRFQVIDKDTGKVVRQFPPEDINGVKQRAKAIPAMSGVLIDSIA